MINLNEFGLISLDESELNELNNIKLIAESYQTQIESEKLTEVENIIIGMTNKYFI
jgi:hypothetical protein